jgi:proteasome lid subunit RPN8/RPN11
VSKLKSCAPDSKRGRFVLPYAEKRRLHLRAIRAQQRGHLEVCGVVVVYASGRIKLRFLRNYSTMPYTFEMCRSETRAVRRATERNGQRMLGSFHSHPVGEAKPGPGDISKGFYRGVELIYDVCGRCARLWKVQRQGRTKRLSEISLYEEGRRKVKAQGTRRRRVGK